MLCWWEQGWGRVWARGDKSPTEVILALLTGVGIGQVFKGGLRPESLGGQPPLRTQRRSGGMVLTLAWSCLSLNEGGESETHL